MPYVESNEDSKSPNQSHQITSAANKERDNKNNEEVHASYQLLQFSIDLLSK
jgi:hypothetical protein